MVGALGSGKTATLCVEGIALSLEYPGNVGLVARKTLPELKSTTLKRFFEFLPDPFVVEYNKTDRELKIRTSGQVSTVYFGPLDEIGRYKSLELGWFALDEADETTEDHWLTLCGRLRMRNIPCYGMLATNPTNTNHWIYKRWVVSPTEGYEIFRSKTSENRDNLPEGYENELRKTYDDSWVKRFVEGKFGVLVAGDPCFPNFSEAIHVKNLKPISHLPMLRGWDFGKRRPCVVFCQLTEEGALRIYRTMLGENEDIYQFSDKVIKVSNAHYNTFRFEDYCDIAGKQEHSQGGSDISVLRSKGIFPKFRYSKPDARIQEMRRMMRERVPSGEEMFLVDPCNQYLIEGLMGGFQVDDDMRPKKDGYFEHGIDALGYVICNTCMVESQRSVDIEIPEARWVYA